MFLSSNWGNPKHGTSWGTDWNTMTAKDRNHAAELLAKQQAAEAALRAKQQAELKSQQESARQQAELKTQQEAAEQQARQQAELLKAQQEAAQQQAPQQAEQQNHPLANQAPIEPLPPAVNIRPAEQPYQHHDDSEENSEDDGVFVPGQTASEPVSPSSRAAIPGNGIWDGLQTYLPSFLSFGTTASNNTPAERKSAKERKSTQEDGEVAAISAASVSDLNRWQNVTVNQGATAGQSPLIITPATSSDGTPSPLVISPVLSPAISPSLSPTGQKPESPTSIERQMHSERRESPSF